MSGLLIFYCCFSMLFSVATVKETDYTTKRGFIAAKILFFVFGPILLPTILGDAFSKKLM